MCSEGGRASQQMLARGEWRQASEAEPMPSQQITFHDDAAHPAVPDEPYDARCIVLLRDLPVRCREEEVIRALTELGWSGVISSVCLPLRPAKPGRAHHNRGYGFVYFKSLFAAEAFLGAMVDGFRIGTRSSSKVVQVERTHASRRQEQRASDVTGVSTGTSSVAAQRPSMADQPNQSSSPNSVPPFQWFRV